MTKLPSDLVPWEKIGDQTTLAAKYGKKLVSQNFTRPDGATEEFVLFGQKDWVSIMPVTVDGLVVTNHEYKQGAHRVVHELPAGTADFGDERPEVVAKVELLEETGYEAEELIVLGPPFFMSPRSSWTRCYPFLATGCRKVAEQKFDESEEMAVELIPVERWVELCFDNIPDPGSVTTTMRALKRLGYSLHRPN